MGFIRVSPSKLNTPLAAKAKRLWKMVTPTPTVGDVRNLAGEIRRRRNGETPETYALLDGFSYWLRDNVTLDKGLWQHQGRSYRTGPMLQKYLGMELTTPAVAAVANHEFVATVLGEALAALCANVFIGRWGGEFLTEAYSMAKLGSCMYGKLDAVGFYQDIGCDVAMLWLQGTGKAKFRGRAILWGDKAMDRPYPNGSDDPFSKMLADALNAWASSQGMLVRGIRTGSTFNQRVIWRAKGASYKDALAWPYFDTLNISAELDGGMVFSNWPLYSPRPFRGYWGPSITHTDDGSGPPPVDDATYCPLTNCYSLGADFADYLDGSTPRRGLRKAVRRLPRCEHCNARYKGKGPLCARCETHIVRVDYKGYRYPDTGHFIYLPTGVTPPSGVNYVERINRTEEKTMCVQAIDKDGNTMWMLAHHAYRTGVNYYTHVPDGYATYRNGNTLHPNNEPYKMAYTRRGEMHLKPLSQTYLLLGTSHNNSDEGQCFVTQEWADSTGLPTNAPRIDGPYLGVYPLRFLPYAGVMVWWPHALTCRVALPLYPDLRIKSEWLIIDPQMGVIEFRSLPVGTNPVDVPTLAYGHITGLDLYEAHQFYIQR